MVVGRPIRVEFLVPMEEHSDDDRDAYDVLEAELPDMYEDSASDDEADPRGRFALPNRFSRAREQAENGEEDRFESDSEGELSGHLEESDSRELDSESEIQYVIKKSIPEAGIVARFINRLKRQTSL